MADLPKLDGPSHPPANGGAPGSLIILLHGLGADGNDLLGLAPLLSPLAPDALFLSPHAPYPCDMASVGRQWFSLQQRDPQALIAEIEASAPILDQFITEKLAENGLTDDRLLLLGFSQGTMMALQVALRRPLSCAGVIGFSGLLVAKQEMIDEVRSHPPVLLVHGEADEVISFDALDAATKVLQHLNVPVYSEGRPGLGHGIDERGIQLAATFIRERLGGEKPEEGGESPAPESDAS